MASKNIVHQYFKKEAGGGKIIVKVNPVYFTGTELTVTAMGEASARDLTFDQMIYDDLKIDGFEEVNGMEFNLYAAGLI